MERREMERRTKALTLRVLNLADALPKTTPSGRMIANQLARSGGSVGANYRASGRARSRAEFKAKLGIVEEEADETCFWLEVIIENRLLPQGRVQSLLDEVNEILAIVVASINTTKRKT